MVAGVKKVLVVYESLATPTTTVRALQFKECFQADAELQATFIGRTSERFAALLERWPWRPSLRRPALWAESKVIRRREDRIVEMAKTHDHVLLVTVPSWSLHQRLVELPNTKVITDLIDAVWLPAFQKQGWKHIHQMLATSDTVICENQYTARYASDHNARICIVPDAPQLEQFDRLREHVFPDPDRVTVGWIGGKYTADALYQVFEPLENVFEEHQRAELLLVGADPDRLPRFEKVRVRVVPSYDQVAMVNLALMMDIGIFPMFNVDESLYRGTLKTRIYMSAGLAVIGQRLGENETMIQDGVDGLLAGDNQQWVDALQRLISDVEFRQKLAAAGLAKMRADYTRERCYQRLRDAILST